MRTLTFNRVIQDDPFGRVYHGELQSPPGARAHAVKVIGHDTPDQDDFRARMRDAARLLPMIQHPHLLGVVELVHMAGHDAVLMDYVPGADLGRLLAAGPIPPGPLAHIGAAVAGILAHAHGAEDPTTGRALEYVHRDVKPENVIVGEAGEVYLMDFGVARAAFESRESVTSGLVLGTLHYFAPEILAGKKPTPAADIYALGLTLWEAAMARRWGQPQVHPQRFTEQVDDHLDDLKPVYRSMRDALLGMLQWEPSERPTAAQLRDQLGALAERLGGPTLEAWSSVHIVPVIDASRELATTDPLVGQTVIITESVAAPSGSTTPVPLDEPSELLPRGTTLLAGLPTEVTPRGVGASGPTQHDAEGSSWFMLGGLAVVMGVLATSCTVLSLVAALIAFAMEP
ncbi:MAG: serine/threonine-protein kinase [Myxococcota bacterium]